MLPSLDHLRAIKSKSCYNNHITHQEDYLIGTLSISLWQNLSFVSGNREIENREIPVSLIKMVCRLQSLILHLVLNIAT